jgi:hypothetical protein
MNMSTQLERAWKAAAVAPFEVLFRHLEVGTVENKEKQLVRIVDTST